MIIFIGYFLIFNSHFKNIVEKIQINNFYLLIHKNGNFEKFHILVYINLMK
jgi:hypothetical protein